MVKAKTTIIIVMGADTSKKFNEGLKECREDLKKLQTHAENLCVMQTVYSALRF